MAQAVKTALSRVLPANTQGNGLTVPALGWGRSKDRDRLITRAWPSLLDEPQKAKWGWCDYLRVNMRTHVQIPRTYKRACVTMCAWNPSAGGCLCVGNTEVKLVELAAWQPRFRYRERPLLKGIR